MNLTTELAFIQEAMAMIRDNNNSSLRRGAESAGMMEKVFQARMKVCVDSAKDEYESMRYMGVVKFAFHELRNARDEYRSYFTMANQPMHAETLRMYVETLAIIFSPVCSHWCEYIWCKDDLLGNQGSVSKATWPKLQEQDATVLAQWDYVQKRVSEFRAAMAPKKKKKKKGKAAQPETPPAPPTHANIYVQTSMEPWKTRLLDFLKTHYVAESNSFDLGKKEMLAAVRECAAQDELMKGNKMVMKTAAFVMGKEINQFGAVALETQMPFDEVETLEKSAVYIAKALKLEGVAIYLASDDKAPGDARKRGMASMGKPTVAPFVKE
jgi:leucyl-tRNA synthetase